MISSFTTLKLYEQTMIYSTNKEIKFPKDQSNENFGKYFLKE